MCYSLKHDKNNHTSINKVVYLAKEKKKNKVIFTSIIFIYLCSYCDD